MDKTQNVKRLRLHLFNLIKFLMIKIIIFFENKKTVINLYQIF